jgi:hypothetical protein
LKIAQTSWRALFTVRGATPVAATDRSRSSTSRVATSRTGRSPERGHDQAAGQAAATTVGLTGLRQEEPVISERRWLRALHLLEPFQVLARKLAKGNAAAPTFFGITLEQRLIGVVLTDQREHPLCGLGLGESPLRRPAAPAPPAAIRVRLCPRPPQRANDRLTDPADPRCAYATPGAARRRDRPARRGAHVG